jgi:hypothetical protein
MFKIFTAFLVSKPDALLDHLGALHIYLSI